MPEKEPLYFKEFREGMEEFKKSMGEFKLNSEKKFETADKRFDELGASTAQGFHEVHERLGKVEEDMEGIRIHMEKIEGHIGRYEIRSTHIEDTFIKNYGRRIGDLEKAYLTA